MGCDMHLIIEQQWFGVTDRPEWVYVGEINIPRNYKLFGILAGVRGTIPPLMEPRGLPDDLSIDGKKMTDGKFHSHTWITVDEFQDLLSKGELEKPYGYDAHECPICHHKSGPSYLDEIPVWFMSFMFFLKDYQMGERTRIVFWFDN